MLKFCARITVQARIALQISIAALALFSATAARGQLSTGSISGTVRDPGGAVVPDTSVIAKNTATSAEQQIVTNAQGFFVFPTLPVGMYELDTFRPGFQPYKRTGLVVDVNSKIEADITLQVGEQTEQVTVTQNAIQVETESTQVGDVVTGPVLTAVGLNGRAFTDLLSLQPGIVPMSTQTSDSVVMAGVTVAITPSGNLNPGNQSINGQREDANGFLVNGSDVKEEMNGGTSIIMNLDSISEFRVLTNNFDPEYGNYAGGIVNAVTKSGTNNWHGDAFEFLRNTHLDAKGFFDLHRDIYDQNQYGGTFGGPIKKDKLFFFGDYQGTRTTQSIDAGQITVPTLEERTGNFIDSPGAFTTTQTLNNHQFTVPSSVGGAGLAAQLQNSLCPGQTCTVSAGEPYYFSQGEHVLNDSNPNDTYLANCTSLSQCVFPNATIPQIAWTNPSKNLLQYIPEPNDGPNTFVGQADERLRDDKFSYRVDGNSMRWGNLTAYYFFDDYFLNNPYPSSQGGANVPGFDGINHGRSQLISLGDAKTIGTAMVNEAHLSFMRSENVVGQPSGGLGVSLADQGFKIHQPSDNCTTIPTPVECSGILPLAPQFEGVENTVFKRNNIVLGVPITNVKQANNTYSMNESLSRILGTHTVKAGVSLSFEQVNMNPNAIFDGSFIFNGYQTNNELADFLIGAPNQFNQQDSGSYYPRHKYIGWYGQDSWKIKPNLTFNYGLRMELMQYWSEKYDQVPTFVPGLQSAVFPNAFPGLVYPTDFGVPNTLVPQRVRYAPRFGLAYSPSKSGGFWGKILGGAGSTSIRAGYAMLNTMIQGNSIGVDEPQPPYGLSDTVFNGLMVAPYQLASGPNPDGSQNISPYPLTFPPLNANASHPNSTVIFNDIYNPQSGMTAPTPKDTYPYAEDYFLSYERQLPKQTVLDISYVGSQAHHLPLVFSANPGNPALCMALNQPGVLASGLTCGPGGENNNYTLAQSFLFGGITYPAGSILQGTRFGLNTGLINPNVTSGNYFGNDDYQGTIGNSNYNSLQVSVRTQTKRVTYSVAYTYSKSIDQASALADAVDPFNFTATRGLSAWNLTSNFVATYDFQLPFDLVTHRARRLLTGWELSGVTHVSTGFPVTLSTGQDLSLQGSSPNGVNNRFLDMPDLTGQSLNIHSHPQSNGLVYFNPGAFQLNALGTVGNAGRRTFSGPGEFNTDLVLKRVFQIRETQTLEVRWEAFNVFNTTQFFGAASVDGTVGTPNFGHVVNSTQPRLMQLAAKYTF